MTQDESANVLEASALYYALRFGWAVFPLHGIDADGRCSCRDTACGSAGKHPRTKHGLIDRTKDEAQIRWWWAKWPRANVGIATGLASGFAALDEDPRHGGDESLAELVALHGPLPQTVEVLTGGGGRHLYFALGEAMQSRNGILPGLDLKSEGGYVVAPPSLHASGRGYEWEASSRPGEVALAPLPQWVRELRSAHSPTFATDQGGDRIPTGYRHSALVSFAGTMRRRGLTETEMLGALFVVNIERCDPPLTEPEVRVIAQTIATYAPADAPQFAVIADEDTVDTTWSAPNSLRAARDLPTFPIDAFPDWLAEFVRAEAVTTQTPVDMAALFALGSLATVSGGRVSVRAARDWNEGTNIFAAVAMEPGSRKSAVERDTKAPIIEYERRLAEQERPRIAELASLRRVAEARRDRAEKAAATATQADRFALEQEAIAAARALEAIVVPAEPRLFTADATPEALMSLLAAHGGRMSVLSAEGGVFDLMAGRYSNGIPNLDVYLSGHAGDTLRVDRRNRPPEFVDRPALTMALAAHGGRMSVLSAEAGVFDLMAGRYSSGIPNLDVYLSGHAGDTLRVDRRNRPPEFVDRPALTMALAAQPYVLRKIGRNGEMSGRGLLDRFLYAVPTGNVGFRSSSPPPMSETVRARYAERLTELAVALAAYDEPFVLRLDSAAADVLTAWRDELEPRRRPDRDLGAMQGWASKLDGATVRIAGLLHLAAGPDSFGERISRATMERAISVARYLIPHAQTAFDLMGADGPLEDARRVLRWIVAGQRTDFTKRECHRAHEAHFTRVDDLEPALAILAEHGWIRLAEDPKRPGRPSTRYQVNPGKQTTELTQPTEPPSDPSFVGSVGFVVRTPSQTEPPGSVEVAMD